MRLNNKMEWCFVVATFLVFTAGVSCENFTEYECDDNPCTQKLVGYFAGTSWTFVIEDAMVGWHKSIEIVMVSNTKENVGIGYSKLNDFLVILNGNNNAAIVVTKRKAYLIDSCKTKISFKDPTDNRNTFLDIYKDDVEPFVKMIDDKKEKDEGFLIRHIFMYLYDHKNIKGAPCLKGRRKLQDRLHKYFGDVFQKVHKAFQSKKTYVYHYEASILAILLGDGQHQMNLRIVLPPLIVYRIDSDSETSQLLGFGINKYPTHFADEGPFHWFTTTMYQDRNNGQMPFIMRTLVITDVTVKDKKGKEYFISFGTDTEKKLYEIKLRKCDGTVDLSILFYPEVNTWYFACRITDLVLVMPQKGSNYGMFKACTGASIIVNRVNQMANPSTNNAKAIVKQFNDYYAKLCMYEMLRAVYTVKVEENGDLAFDFKSFISNSYSPTGLMLLMASHKTKKELSKNFGDFVEGFRMIKGYDCKYKQANVALFFFKEVCLPGLKEDFRAMVKAVGVNQSNFRCNDVISATYTCTYNKYAEKVK